MKPIVFFDIESTGLDIARDRIVSIALLSVIEHDGFPLRESGCQLLINPGIPIPPESTAIHGITNEMVSSSPHFKDVANEIYDIIGENDLCGFNLINFDVPMLWEEFNRAGIYWDPRKNSIIDAGNIFKKKEERTLAAAVKFYCGETLENAHNAAADVAATVKVLHGQLERYHDLAGMDRKQLAEFSRFDRRVDLAGKIVLNDKDEPVYNFGKSKGVRVIDDPGFARWMIDKDFSMNTKMALMEILNEN